MKVTFLSLLTLIGVSLDSHGQSKATLFDNGSEIKALNSNSNTYSLEIPVNSEEGNKVLNSPLVKSLNYRLTFEGPDDLFSNGVIYWEDVVDNSGTNWKNFAKKGGVLKKELKASLIHDELKMLFDNNKFPSADFDVKIKIQAIKKSINMEYFTVSETSVSVPVASFVKYFEKAKESEIAQAKKDGVAAFKANWKMTLSDPVLADAIEKHIEAVRDVDFITIYPKDLHFKGTTNNFSWEATVIFTENGECKRNWLHGQGYKNSSEKYTVSTYNAGTPDKPMNCSDSEAFRNR